MFRVYITKPPSTMKKTRMNIFAIFMIALIFSLNSCSKDIEGEITGIEASSVLSDLTDDNDLENLVYNGRLIVTLSDGEKIKIEFPEELLKDVKGCPTFDKKINASGIVAKLDIKIEEKQKILLTSTGSGNWEIVKIFE